MPVELTGERVGSMGKKGNGKMFFRCKNCGGNVVYSPERHGMYCPFCESGESGERAEGQ